MPPDSTVTPFRPPQMPESRNVAALAQHAVEEITGQTTDVVRLGTRIVPPITVHWNGILLPAECWTLRPGDSFDEIELPRALAPLDVLRVSAHFRAR